MSFPVSSSLLDAIVLAIVAREETYGYKITQDIRQVLVLSESTLYPVLRRLLKSGCLDTREQLTAGRMRRYYFITEKGKEQLAAAKLDWSRYRSSIESVFFGEGNL